MTTLPPELDQTLSAPQDATPARQALLVGLALAAAAQVGVEARCRAWLAGRISGTDLAYSGGLVILQGVVKATLAGEHFAEVEWATRISPKVIPVAHHERLTRALFSVVKDAEKARAAELKNTLAKVSEVSDSSEVLKVSDELTMRATRLARAEVVAAGRTGYGEAVAQVVGADPDFVWCFETDAEPCGRCVALARETFPTFEQAPKQGAHPNCSCALTAFYRKG